MYLTADIQHYSLCAKFLINSPDNEQCHDYKHNPKNIIGFKSYFIKISCVAHRIIQGWDCFHSFAKSGGLMISASCSPYLVFQKYIRKSAQNAFKKQSFQHNDKSENHLRLNKLILKL